MRETKTAYGKKIYWKVQANLDAGKVVTFWANSRTDKNGHIMFLKCKKDGGDYGTAKVTYLNIVIVQAEDILYEKIARMSLKYGELEVTGE